MITQRHIVLTDQRLDELSEQFRTGMIRELAAWSDCGKVWIMTSLIKRATKGADQCISSKKTG